MSPHRTLLHFLFVRFLSSVISFIFVELNYIFIMYSNVTTGYGLDGPGIESRRGGGIFRTFPDRPWGPPSLLYNGYRVFPGGKERLGHDADPSPPSSALVMNE